MKTKTLSNGLTVCVDHCTDKPVVCVQFVVATGSCAEPVPGSGISHLVEHMVFKGTTKYPTSVEVNERAAAIGASNSWNAYTAQNRTVYTIDGDPNKLEEYLDLLTQLTLHPLFDEAELASESDVVRREMAMYRDDDEATAWEKMQGIAYKSSPEGYPVIGLEERFNAITREDLVAYHSARYVPSNMAVVVVGNAELDDVASALERLTSDFAYVAPPVVVTATEPKQLDTRRVVATAPTHSAKLFLGWKIPPLGHKDIPALMTLSSVLGGGQAGRLYTNLVERQDTGVLNVVCGLDRNKNSEGLLCVLIETAPDNVERAKEALFEYFADAAESCLRDFNRETNVLVGSKGSFLMSVQNRVKTKSAMSLESPESRAGIYVTSWANDRTFVSDKTLTELSVNVGAKEVTESFLRYFAGTPYNEVVLLPTESKLEDEPDERLVVDAKPEYGETARGLRFCSVTDPARKDLISFSVQFRAGCQFDPKGKAGMSALVERFLLPSSVVQRLAELGAIFEVYSYSRSISIDVTVSDANFTDALDAISKGCLAAGCFDVVDLKHSRQSEFNKVKQVLVNATAEAAADPVGMARRAHRRTRFGHVSCGNPGLGTPESVDSITIEEYAEFAKKVCVVENCVVAVWSSHRHTWVRTKLRDHFERIMDKREAMESEVPTTQELANSHHETSREQSVVLVGYEYHPNPKWTPLHEYAVSRVATSCLNGMSGVLMTELREKRGLCYYATCSVTRFVDLAIVEFYSGVQHVAVDTTVELLQSLLQQVKTEGVTEQCFEETREDLVKRLTLGLLDKQESIADLAYEMVSGGVPSDYNALSELREVTREDVNEFLSRLLSTDSVVVTVN